MFCSNCGTRLPDNANFCLECGKPVAGTTPKTEDEKWGICEIVCEDRIDEMSVWEATKANWTAGRKGKLGYKNVSTESYKFVAMVTSPNGISKVRETNKYYMRDDAEQTAKKEIEEMVNQLVKNGWEATGRGEKWYNYKFRRRDI